MRSVNEFISTGPFDIYELQLFHLVVEHQSFTRAGQAAGLTQSAMTRQILGIEERLGVKLFERTTRSVRLTPAGAALYARSGSILSQVNEAIQVIKQGSDFAPKTLRVGISRSIGLAYLPGFFHRFQREFPAVKLSISHESSTFIMAAIESGELEAGIVTAPPRISTSLTIARKFVDEFTLIAPPGMNLSKYRKAKLRDVSELLKQHPAIFINQSSTTGKLLRGWLARNDLPVNEMMEADDFDLIANLVSLGVGISFVPHRVLALLGNRRPVQRLNTKPKFSRELVVVVRKGMALSSPLKGFVENVLF